MHCKPEKLDDAEQASLRLRLEALVTRFASRSLQDMLDFDHLTDDGLSNGAAKLPPQIGDCSPLDRENR